MMVDKQIPETLYKYRRIGKGAEQILTQHKIKFDKPSAFNDLFECRPLYWENPEHPNHKKYLLNTVAKSIHDPRERVRIMQEYERRYSSPQPLNDVDGFEWIQNRLGILCLSEGRDNLPLWGLYADSHKGICIGFNTMHSFFSFARQVHYQEEYPTIERIGDNPEDIVDKIMFTKGVCWENEKEWRIALLQPTPKRVEEINRHPDPVYREIASIAQGPGEYLFSPRAITEVIIGAQTPQGDIDTVIGWIKKGGSHPKLLKAKRNQYKFALDFEDITDLLK